MALIVPDPDAEQAAERKIVDNQQRHRPPGG